MNLMNRQSSDYKIDLSREEAISLSKSFLSNVFSWMFLALAITALVSYWFSSSPQLMGYLYSTGQTGTSPTMLGWIVFLSPLGFVLLMSFGFQKLSATALSTLFVVFAILLGMSLSSIFLIYTNESIFLTFAVTSGMFGLMALIGYTTKTDLTKLGSILMMGLFGIIIAMIVNMFLGSAQLDYIISIIGVIIFTGLTAYDVQMLKRIGMGVDYDHESTRKLVIIGALRLYLDFINLFLFLLRFLGNRR
ncbi:MAG: Bax inhibitor-1/YccA family protein [Bacteroidales bacterium]|nr:Bax inhibitor-1/YccA family protein [Bacteroidales bacterium]MCF8351557.1 Bax inhibitor-1/YccA family protein [Bacteroidales bacterium]MCF8376465.1 Bax inhibitor-1/YccA family protein [Bacteroidales bacterium]MCF8400584.1 Bax inhibitor-1/YccA family protein [Bacteroidales bacterium]